ncbi:unnamed protein product [Effrenium voratum]|nr:unnamed protein product [Effrenium voratum]
MASASGPAARLEEDFQIVRRTYPDVARSMSTSSSLSSPPAKGEIVNGRHDKTPIEGAASLGLSGARDWQKELVLRLERLESQQLAACTAQAEQKEECLSLAAALVEVRRGLAERARADTFGEDAQLRSDFELKHAHMQTSLSAVQAQCEQTRLQVSELRSEQTALRERQATRELRLEVAEEQLQDVRREMKEEIRRVEEKVGKASKGPPDCAAKIMELATCVDEVARQMQDLKQDTLADSALMRTRLEASSGENHSQETRLENLEVQQRDEQARFTTESAALKARLQALELRLAAAALEKISAQATSANKAQEQLELRLGRLEAALAGQVSKPLSQGVATTASQRSASASVSVASLEDSRSGLAHLVGEMDAELRVELNSRLRLLTADLKGEIMADVAARVANTEASVGSIEAKLSGELDKICEDFRMSLQSLNKAQLVPRVKKLEEQAERTNLVLATIQEARGRVPSQPTQAEGRRSLEPRERSQDVEDAKARQLISTGLRQRLHGLVSALSWTLGQVAEADASPEGLESSTSNTGSGGRQLSARRASEGTVLRQRSNAAVSGGSLRPGEREVLEGPCVQASTAAPSQPIPEHKVSRQLSVSQRPELRDSQSATPGGPRSPQRGQAHLRTAQVPQSQAQQMQQKMPPANGSYVAAWPDNRAMSLQGTRRPINSVNSSRGGSPPQLSGYGQRSMPGPGQRPQISASASPYGGPANRSAQVMMPRMHAAPGFSTGEPRYVTPAPCAASRGKRADSFDAFVHAVMSLL